MPNHIAYPSFSRDASALAMANGRYRSDCTRQIMLTSIILASKRLNNESLE